MRETFLMIPRFELLPDASIPGAATFWFPTLAELEEGGLPGGFHDSELILTNIHEAESILESEIEALDFVDRNSKTALEFDDLAADVEFEAAELPSDEAPEIVDGAWYGLNGLELGVAGLTYALNVLGAITVASCRSHSQAYSAWSEYPIVIFAADRRQLGQLQPLALAAGCGFEVDEVNRPDFIAVVAPSVVEIMNLASLALALAKRRAQKSENT